MTKPHAAPTPAALAIECPNGRADEAREGYTTYPFHVNLIG